MAARQHKIDDEALQFLTDIIETPSPSGYEFDLQRLIAARMKGVADAIESDVHGNLAVVKNPGGTPRVMLAAHCDEIGLMVKYISDEGFLFVQPIGCPSLPFLPGQHVRVHTRKKSVPGVISMKRPVAGDKRELKIGSLWVDIGAADRKRAEATVCVGDPVTVAVGMQRLGKDLLAGRAFDDRAGVFIVMEAMRRLKDAEIGAAVYGVSTVQEEVGSRGAISSVFNVDPDIGIAVEVDHATDFPEANRKTQGDLSLGKGAVLMRGSNINPVVGDLLMETAKKARIPVQLSVCPGPTPTDASVMQVNRGGVATALVRVPVRYMHTPTEIMSITDLEHAIRLLVAFVSGLKPGIDLKPV